MTDSKSPTKQQELTRMAREIYNHGKKTGDWLAWRTIEALVAQVSGVMLKSQTAQQTKKNMATIMRNFRAQCRIRDAQQPTTTKRAKKA